MSILFDGVSSSEYTGLYDPIMGLKPVAYFNSSYTQTITDTGGNVTQWDDLSGNGYHATVITGNPVTNSTTYNGKNVIEFSSTGMETPDFSSAITQPNTVIFFGKCDTLPTSYCFTNKDGTDQALFINSTDEWKLFAGAGDLSSVTANTSPNLHVVNFDGTNCEHYENNFLIQSGDAGTNGTDGLVMGSSNTGTLNMDGWIGVCAVFDRILTDDERQAVFEFISEQWMTEVATFLAAGQSNLNGSTTLSTLPQYLKDYYATPNTDLKIFYKECSCDGGAGGGFILPGSFTQDGEWWTLYNGHNAGNQWTSQNVGFDSTTVADSSAVEHGSILSFAYEFAQENPGEELYIIKGGYPSTSIETHWRISDAATGFAWDLFQNYFFKPAISQMFREGKRPRYIGVYWMQGESDTTFALAPSYRGRLDTLKQRFEQDLGVRNAEWVIGGLTQWWYDFQDGTTVETAQINFAADNDNMTYLDQDIYSQELDERHWDSQGYTDIGIAVHDLLKGN